MSDNGRTLAVKHPGAITVDLRSIRRAATLGISRVAARWAQPTGGYQIISSTPSAGEIMQVFRFRLSATGMRPLIFVYAPPGPLAGRFSQRFAVTIQGA
jgi:hypothetical protein